MPDPNGEQGRVVLVRAIGEKEPTYTGDWFLPVGDPESFRNYRHDSFRYEVKTFVPESDQQAEREMCTTHPDRPANAFTAYCSECWQRERNQQVERGLREALVEIERENTSRVYSVAGWVPRWAKNLLIARWTRDRARAALASTPPESEQRCTGLPCSSCGCTDPNCPVHGGESEQEEPRGDG